MKVNKKVIIILPEIYGANDFFYYVCQKFQQYEFDIVCPTILKQHTFSYEEAKHAYASFMENIGFDITYDMKPYIDELKNTYEKVFVLGFSVGATIAWRCSEYPSCDGIIACYGSRIRDYLDVQPHCPTLLLFAREDSFDVETIVHKLQSKPFTQAHILEGKHGFMDPYASNYQKQSAQLATTLCIHFLDEHS